MFGKFHRIEMCQYYIVFLFTLQGASFITLQFCVQFLLVLGILHSELFFSNSTWLQLILHIFCLIDS